MCEHCASNALSFSPSRRSFLGAGAGFALAGGLVGPALAQGVTTTPTR